jgi:integrase
MDRREKGYALPKGVEARKTASGETIRISIAIPGRKSRFRRSLGLPVTAPNVKYAHNLLEEMRTSIAAGNFDITRWFPDEAPDYEESQITIGEAVSNYIERKRTIKGKGGWQASTYDTRKKRYDNWVVPFFGDLTVSELTADHVREFLEEASGILQEPSGKGVLALLNPIVDDALAEGKIARHPYRHIDVSDYLEAPTISARKEKIDPFTPQEIKQILQRKNFTSVNDFALFKFMLNSGVRRQEAPLLKWKDYNKELGHLEVNQALGEANNQSYIKGTKTGTERTLELLPQAIEAIEMMEPYRGRSKYIFFDERTDDWYHLRTVYWRWKSMLGRAGIEYRSVKQTRHTFVSLLLSQGIPAYWVQSQTGHTSTKMFDEHYAKYIPGMMGDRITFKLIPDDGDD